MSDQPQAGAAFGVPAPAIEVVQESPATAPAGVPAAMRARTKDRLKKRAVKRAIARLDGEEEGDFTDVLVIGLKSGQMDEIRALFPPQEEGDDTPQAVGPMQRAMFKLMCFDPEDETPLFDDWTDAEFDDFPLADGNVIMKAIAIVNGQTSEPGKGSPSTAGDDSSSSSQPA